MAGTVTLQHITIGHIRRIIATIVADASDASVPATALPAIEGRLVAIATNPGATAPTANYDITVEDQHGADVLQGCGLNRHTTNSERAAVVHASSSVHPVVGRQDTLTLKIANNAVNSAQIVVELLYTPGV